MVVFSQQPYSFEYKQPWLYDDGMNMTLAERLKIARKKNSLSQKRLGELIGVTQAAIQKIESGKAKETTKIFDLAQTLGVRPEWLASGVGPMREDSENEGALPVVALEAPRKLTSEEEELLEIFRSLPDEETKRFMTELRAKKAHYDAIFEEMLRKRHGKVS